MNKIYKVMYSKVKQCAVVVSEIAKSHGHNGESSDVRKHAALTAAVLIALGSLSFTTAFVPMTAEAATKTGGSNFVGVERTDELLDDKEYDNYGGKGANGADSITLGLRAKAGEGTITIGDRNAGASLGSVYVGQGDIAKPKLDTGGWVTSIGYNSDATGYGSIALGSNAVARNSYALDSKGESLDLNPNFRLNSKPDIQRASVAIGYGANADNGNIAIGSYSDASTDLRTAKTADGKEIKSYLTDKKADSYVSVGKTGALRRISNVADGAADSDVATIGQLKALSDKAGVYNEGWGINIDKTNGNTISVNHNLGNNMNAQLSSTGLILGGDFSNTYDGKYGGAAGDYAVTLGGESNFALGKSSVAAGGMDNTADGNQAFVGGGSQNTASKHLSSAIGGAKNTASGVQSSAFGGLQNTASGQLSSAIGGDQNTASGSESSAIGGAKNIASGWRSSAFGGTNNISLDMLSSTLGGMNSVVLGYYATGIAGGSTGSNAWNALAAGSNSVVTVENGTAIGYQATTNEEGTIAFGHDKGDISGYTVAWKQKATSANGKYYGANGIEITKDQYEALRNPDYTFNDYSQDPTITENTHKTAAYNRLVKVHDGKNAHDAVVMEQLKPYTKSDASNIGSNLKTYTVGDDGETITETNAKEEQQKDNKDAWGQALGAGTLSTADAAKNSDQLITGKTLYNYDKPTTNGTYVNQNQTTGQNLSALDTQVKANTDALTKPNNNIKYYSVTAGPSLGYDQYTNENNDGAKGTASLAAGNVTHTDGVASTVVGSYSAVFGTGLQGAAAVSYGTVNVNNNTDTTKAYSGVANSIVGQANMTTNSNAAIIYGAGNTVTDSYRDIDKDKAEAILNSTGNAEQLKNALQDAVPTSGAQVMVMDGGNSVDKAYMTQVTGVGNKVTGADSTYTEGTSTQYNFVDGFQNELTNGKHDYIIGSKNKVSGDSVDTNQSNIIFGDNHKLTNQQNNVIIGSSDTADDETTASNIVAIGHNAKVSAEGGVAIGSGSEASTPAGVTGYDPTTTDEKSTDTAAAWTSKKAAVSVGTADETRQITGVAAGKEETDAVNVAQLKKLNGMKANMNADNIGKNLNHKADGTAVTEEDKTANENAWGTAIGTGEIAEGNGQLVTGKTVYAYNKPVAETGKTLNYVSADKTTGQNLTTLDEHVKTNADAIGTNTKNITTNTTNITKNAGDITNLKNLSNITDEGRTVIKNLSKDAVKVEAGDRVTVTSTDNKETGTITYKVSANNNGTVTAGDQNLVSGDTVNTAINNAITNAGTATDTKLAGKANVDATNIGKNLKGADGKTAASDADKTANENAWGTAIGTGEIAEGNGQLVTGKTVYAYNKPVAETGKTLNYVSADKTTGQNLTTLDEHVKTNADAIGTNTKNITTNTTNITKNAGDITNLKNLSNITDEGRTVIKNLSKDAVKVEAGDRVTVTSTDNKETGTITYKVSANNNGTVTAGDQNLVSGDTVNTAINNAINNAGTTTDTKLAGKANVNADNIGKNLNHKADGTAVTDEDKTANENDWGAAIGTGSIAADNGQLVTGKTVYAYNKPVAAEGKTLNYVSDTKTTGQNLGSLDAQVGTNTGDISNLKNLSNISSAGETVIKNLAKGSIGMEDGSHTTASHRDVNGVDTYKVDVTVDGQVTENNKGIVDGGTVYNAIQDVKTKTSADLANKANVDASNLSDENVKSWREKLGNGEVVSGNKGLVTGDTVFKAVDTKANRDGSNLTTDEADKFSEKIAVGKVEANDKRAVSGETVSKAISDLTGDMNTKLDGKANTSLDNITDTGKNVIRDLAKGSAKVIDGTNTTVTTVVGKGETPTTYAVNVEGKGTVTSGNTGLISGGTAYTELRPADGSYVKQNSTTAANLTVLDTGLKATSDLIHTNTSHDTIQIGENSTATKIDVSGKDANGKTTGRVITGVVSDANDPNSAANVGYVNGVTAANTQQIYRDMNNAYGRLNNNINKAAAGSNALAALHPLDYDPDDKADFAVGYGHYRNANAAAVGAFYHPNENTMVNVGVSLGNGDPGFNAGVSFKVGRGGAGREAMSKTEMAKVINSQSKEIDALKKDNADKDKRIDALEQKMAEILAKLDKNGK